MKKFSLNKITFSIGILVFIISGCANLPQNIEISSNRNISTQLEKPILTAPAQPIFSIDGKEAKVTFNWTGNAEHYDLMVRYPDNTSDVASYVRSPIKTTSVTVAFKPNEKPYKWWIRAYASEDPSQDFIDSDFGQFIVNESRTVNDSAGISPSLLPAELISPGILKMSSPENIVLTFNWTGNGKKYDLLFKKPGVDDFNAIATNLVSTNYEMKMSGSALGTYTWKIRSYDDEGNYVDSAVRTFSFGG